MTERQIENRVKKLQELEAQQKALKAEAEEIKNVLKEELESQELEELKAASAKDKAYKEEQAAKQAERAAFNAAPLYERNETMKLIGYSHYSTFAAPSAEYGGGFCDIIQAYKNDCCSRSLADTGLDFFIYGMICGIKEQRKRGKAKC